MNKVPPEGTALEPLQISDRVDNNKFGLGTISAAPDGDKCPVLFDDPEHGMKCIARRFLFLVTRPDAKGGPYWAHEYQKLLEAALEERARTSGVMEYAFRDTSQYSFDAAKVRQRLEGEKASIDALLNFLDADEAGEHP